MGLDGISVNQLRVTPEHNSSELNSQVKFSINQEGRIVDGLAEGQKVDPDKENEHEKPTLNKKFGSKDDSQEEETEETVEEPVEKYDLSRSDKYTVKVEEETDNILIIEKATKRIIQRIDAEQLSKFVNYLSGPNGSIINRKY